MSARTVTSKKREDDEKSENNRRRLQRILRSMMRDGLGFPVRQAGEAGGIGQLPYRRVIE